MTTAETVEEMEDVESFRQRARAWINENLPPVKPGPGDIYRRSGQPDDVELAEVQRNRQLQRMLFDAGFAGICYPKEYGGQGLSPAHQQAFEQELAGHEYPAKMQIPTFSPCATVLLEFGNHEQKLLSWAERVTSGTIRRAHLSFLQGRRDEGSGRV